MITLIPSVWAHQPAHDSVAAVQDGGAYGRFPLLFSGSGFEIAKISTRRPLRYRTPAANRLLEYTAFLAAVTAQAARS